MKKYKFQIQISLLIILNLVVIIYTAGFYWFQIPFTLLGIMLILEKKITFCSLQKCGIAKNKFSI